MKPLYTLGGYVRWDIGETFCAILFLTLLLYALPTESCLPLPVLYLPLLICAYILSKDTGFYKTLRVIVNKRSDCFCLFAILLGYIQGRGIPLAF